jgi:hypothetical protein
MYTVVNYPSEQNGYTISGTLTTNGSTGTDLPDSDIIKWDITIHGVTPPIELTESNSNITPFTFNATTSTITVGSGAIAIIGTTEDGQITWAGPSTIDASGSYSAAQGNTVLWGASGFGANQAVATVSSVPEPSSAVLASIGAVVAFLALGWCRHRREQRRQAAA